MSRLIILAICLAVCLNNEAYFNGLSKEEFKKQYLGLELSDLSHVPTANYNGLLSASELPESYNFFEQHEECRNQIRNQQSCGSCWAFAGSGVLANRFCKQSNHTVNEVLSPQFMLNCDRYDAACNGGRLDTEWRFLTETGTTSDSCNPYRSGGGYSGFYCDLNMCEDGSPIKIYKAQSGSFQAFRDIESIKAEIYQNGPVETGFLVYSDFPHYQRGDIYVRKSSEMMGGHAVKIVGWGVRDGVNYWISENSWGPSWGDDGYFKIKMGECNFDTTVVSGLASVNSVPSVSSLQF